MISATRHPLDDLTDNPMAQTNFVIGFISALKTAGWSFDTIEGFLDTFLPEDLFIQKQATVNAELQKFAADPAAPPVAADQSARFNKDMDPNAPFVPRARRSAWRHGR